jgi:hypothetical protein
MHRKLVVEKDERRTSNIERPTSNEKETPTLGTFSAYPGQGFTTITLQIATHSDRDNKC